MNFCSPFSKEKNNSHSQINGSLRLNFNPSTWSLHIRPAIKNIFLLCFYTKSIRGIHHFIFKFRCDVTHCKHSTRLMKGVIQRHVVKIITFVTEKKSSSFFSKHFFHLRKEERRWKNPYFPINFWLKILLVQTSYSKIKVHKTRIYRILTRKFVHSQFHAWKWLILVLSGKFPLHFFPPTKWVTQNYFLRKPKSTTWRVNIQCCIHHFRHCNS